MVLCLQYVLEIMNKTSNTKKLSRKLRYCINHQPMNCCWDLDAQGACCDGDVVDLYIKVLDSKHVNRWHCDSQPRYFGCTSPLSTLKYTKQPTTLKMSINSNTSKLCVMVKKTQYIKIARKTNLRHWPNSETRNLFKLIKTPKLRHPSHHINNVPLPLDLYRCTI